MMYLARQYREFNNNLIKIDIGNEYEQLSVPKSFFNFLWITFVTILPYKISHFLLVKSRKAKVIKRYSTRFQALEEMYNYRPNVFKFRLSNLFDEIWLNQKNPKALRNRLKLFKKILKFEIDKKKYQKEIKLLSIGSGSARGIIETLSDFYKSKKYNCKLIAVLIDRDEDAINYSKYLADKYKVINFISYYNKDIKYAYNDILIENPDIIEMVGILDYFNDEKVICVINRLFDLLRSGGVIITCNINKNLEERFISKTVKWKMIHRTPRQFFDLLNKTKFNNNIEIIYEPLMVHGIAILRKYNA